MLGIGKVPELLDTRQIESALLEGLATAAPGEESWIITPYSTMDKLSSVRRGITEACKREVQLRFVVRDEPEQVESASRGLMEAMGEGMELFALHRLHAKLYWFEKNFGILTSANLVDGSFEKSTEVGLLVPFGGLHEQLRGWIESNIEQTMRPIAGEFQSSRLNGHTRLNPNRKVPSKDPQGGYCIRCGKGIPADPKKPFCYDHYKNWSAFSNPNYEEKFCHICGRTAETSMARPMCYTCFKRRAS